MKRTVKILEYNWAQLLFLLSAALITVLEWGRGTGKSTIIAKRIIDCVNQLPRSTGMMYGESYRQIKSRTLPATIAGLEDHGYIKNIHFFVCELPPRKWLWKEAYQPVTDPLNCIYFWNGTVLIMVSQDGNAASGRGMNVDWIVADEGLLLDGQKFMTDASATNRGNLYRKAIYPDGSWKYYKDCALHHSILIASSTPITLSGQWFFQYEEAAKDPANKTFFLRASAEVNRHNLGDDFFRNQQAIMPEFLYNAEVLNIRMGSITNGFYPKLSEKLHCYNTYNLDYYKNYEYGTRVTCEADDDINADYPLILGVDWGANINCLVVAQYEPRKQLRFINALHVKSPKILDDLAREEFVPYYEPLRKRNNKVHIFYDPSGNTAQANTRQTYAQQFAAVLTAAGWDVELLTRGQYNHMHELKYNLWNNILSESDDRYPKVMFNKHNCSNLWISMTNAPAKRGTKTAVQKVKSSERNIRMAQEHATHYSDACDLIVMGLFADSYTNQDFIPIAGVRQQS